MSRIFTFRRLLTILLLTIALFIFFQAASLVRSRYPISVSDAGVVRGFVEWFGVLFGLIIAFVLVEAWTNYNRVVEEIDKEADAWQMLDWSARLLGEGFSQPITIAIKSYAELTLEAKGHGENSVQFRQVVNQLYQQIGRAVRNAQNIPVGIELLKRLNEALDTRGDRIQHAENKVPRLLWIMLIFSTSIWLLAFFGIGIENLLLAIAIVGSAVFIVTFLLFIIRDLGRPFSGEMVADFSSFQDLLDNLENWESPPN
jgi:hypothetical protein